MNFPEHIRHMLHLREENGSLRKLRQGFSGIDFSSNDYLGLASNAAFQTQLRQTLNDTEIHLSGATGSRLISGNHHHYPILESQLKNVFEAEACLVFNSGYAANQGVVASIPQKGDTILYDQLAHVCLKEGAWLSKAQSFAFKHNDMDDLERRLRTSTGQVYIVTETLFSMDGDQAPLANLVVIARKYGAFLIVDEAHSTGVYGSAGAGLLVELGLADQVFARIYTFGKAMGVHGACVAGSQQLIDYLINFSRPFIYTTALPPHSTLSISAAFNFLKDNMYLQEQLKSRIEMFRDLTKNLTGKQTSYTAIQPILVSGNNNCRAISDQLINNGFDVRPILAPTVKEGSERLRISLHANHSDKELQDLSKYLHSFLNSSK